MKLSRLIHSQGGYCQDTTLERCTLDIQRTEAHAERRDLSVINLDCFLNNKLNRTMNFEEQIQQKVQQTILKQIGDCRMIEYHHGNKKQIPEDIIQRAWGEINWEEVIKFVTKELQDKICQTIVQNMITEAKTDVKAILSVEGVRQRIRMEAYPKIKEIIGL